jgi:hypothetical protein
VLVSVGGASGRHRSTSTGVRPSVGGRDEDGAAGRADGRRRDGPAERLVEARRLDERTAVRLRGEDSERVRVERGATTTSRKIDVSASAIARSTAGQRDHAAERRTGSPEGRSPGSEEVAARRRRTGWCA